MDELTESRELPAVMPRREDAVDVAAFDGEFVVYDSRAGQAHLIGGFDAVVFDACDGVTTSAALLDEVLGAFADAERTDRPQRDDVEQAIASALDGLAGAGVLEGTDDVPPPCVGCGRKRTHRPPGLLGRLLGDRPPRNTARARRT